MNQIRKPAVLASRNSESEEWRQAAATCDQDTPPGGVGDDRSGDRVSCEILQEGFCARCEQG